MDKGTPSPVAKSTPAAASKGEVNPAAEKTLAIIKTLASENQTIPPLLPHTNTVHTSTVIMASRRPTPKNLAAKKKLAKKKQAEKKQAEKKQAEKKQAEKEQVEKEQVEKEQAEEEQVTGEQVTREQPAEETPEWIKILDAMNLPLSYLAELGAKVDAEVKRRGLQPLSATDATKGHKKVRMPRYIINNC